MMGTSKIEWTEKTWNPITGCTKIKVRRYQRGRTKKKRQTWLQKRRLPYETLPGNTLNNIRAGPLRWHRLPG